MSLEAMLSVLWGLGSVGAIVVVTREQTKTLAKGHVELKAEIKEVRGAVDKCITKSDFPAHFALEARKSGGHVGEE